jgi:hypothetical protein
MFNSDLLSIDKIEHFENSFLVYGYYDEKYFALDISNNSFSLLFDDTECTDAELQEIFKYIIENNILLGA